MTTSHAVRLDIAGATATVVSADKAVTDWSARYFGQWWHATETPAKGICTGPAVLGEVSRDSYADMSLKVTQAPNTSITYARAQTLVAHDEEAGVILAVSPEEELAYSSEPDAAWMAVVGCATEPVATATARLAREMVRGILLRDGWSVLHASAVVGRDGRTVLTFGKKGAGKTTTALAMAARCGLGLLANDRVFVRPNGNGGVDVLPWPSAAALGLGLLNALGWFDIAQERLEGGETLHPTQDGRVTEALRAGRREPMWNGGKELKAQVFPDQFTRWFSVPLATGGEAATLVFPRIETGVTPAEEEGTPGLSNGDFMSGATEDRYPDVFELARVDGGGTEESRHEVAHRLAELPHHAVVLGHDIAANADFLAKLTDVA